MVKPCLWCRLEASSPRRLEPGQRRECPECGHAFQGKGWDGIDAHWKARHEGTGLRRFLGRDLGLHEASSVTHPSQVGAAASNNRVQVTNAARCAPFAFRSWGQSLRAAFAADPGCWTT